MMTYGKSGVEPRPSEIERLKAELAAQQRRAELQDEFLSAVAHELRAPLGAILGWAHMLRRRNGQEELEKGLSVIEQSVQAQASLIDDLMVASRMASDRIRLDVGPLELAGIVDGAIESMRPAFADKHVELRTEFEPVGAMRGDPMRVRQVVGNLLANALKFTPRGGHVEVSLRPSHGVALLTVTDSGAGIAPDLLPHVFERFQRNREAGRSHGGLGLGLAIARHLARLHGGDIEAQSAGEGRGAAFTVRLPL